VLYVQVNGSIKQNDSSKSVAMEDDSRPAGDFSFLDLETHGDTYNDLVADFAEVILRFIYKYASSNAICLLVLASITHPSTHITSISIKHAVSIRLCPQLKFWSTWLTISRPRSRRGRRRRRGR